MIRAVARAFGNPRISITERASTSNGKHTLQKAQLAPKMDSVGKIYASLSYTWPGGPRPWWLPLHRVRLDVSAVEECMYLSTTDLDKSDVSFSGFTRPERSRCPFARDTDV